MTTPAKTPFARRNKPGGVAASAMMGGYWVAQMLASYFVSGAIMGTSSKMAGALFFGLFAVLFVLHLFKPWSKAAAILGLCSLGAFTVMMAYLSGPGIAARALPVELMILISASLALLGITADAVHTTDLQL